MRKIYYCFVLIIFILSSSCKTKQLVPLNSSNSKEGVMMSEVAVNYYQLANELAQKYIITDGHVDLPYRLKVQNFRLEREYMGIPIETERGDFDFKRAKKGGLNAPFMSIFIPASYQDGRAKLLADSLINMVNGIANELPDYFVIAHTPQDVQSAFEKGLIALPMGMENGAPIESDLQNVAYFRKRGISYITLTHSKDNHICDSSYDTTRTWNGLSEFGYELVREMNNQGIMVDISHVSDSTFYQVMRTTKVPVIASHSSCRKFTPGFERNMNDDMIRKMKDNGGVIQINFGSTFIDKGIQDYSSKRRSKMREFMEERGVNRDDDNFDAVMEEFNQLFPPKYADIDMVADHIDHVVKLAGIDHVGFGSDYDGVGDSLPKGLKDVASYPNLIRELLERGYSEEDIEKICYKNVFRVWNQVIDYAKKS